MVRTKKFKGFIIADLGASGFFAVKRKSDIGKRSVANAGTVTVLKKKLEKKLSKTKKRMLVK